MTNQPSEFDVEAPVEQAGGRVPIFNLPTLLVVLLFAMVFIHLLRDFVLSRGLDEWVIFTFSFIPARYVTDFAEQNFEWLWSPISYSFLHGSYEHLIFNGLWLTVFGAPVLRRIGNFRFMALFVLSSAAAAFGFAVLNDWAITFLIGASGVVSALMGAACRFAFHQGPNRFGLAFAHLNPRLSILQAMSDRTVLIFVGVWLVGNLLIAFGIPLAGGQGANIAWDAHLFGFAFGFFLFNLFDRRVR